MSPRRVLSALARQWDAILSIGACLGVIAYGVVNLILWALASRGGR